MREAQTKIRKKTELTVKTHEDDVLSKATWNAIIAYLENQGCLVIVRRPVE